jgi:hypothetical protein
MPPSEHWCRPAGRGEDAPHCRRRGRRRAEATVARLVGQLDDFDRTILTRGYGRPTPQSQRVLAERLGVQPVSVQHNQPRAQSRFAELLADPAHQEVGEHAAELGRHLGPYMPADVVDVELRRLGVEPSTQAAQVRTSPARMWVAAGGLRTRQRRAIRKWWPPWLQCSYASLHHPPPACCMP